MRVLGLILSLLIVEGVSAQQQPQFTMFNSTISMFNPAMTGLEYNHYGAATYRNQWTGFDGAPQTVGWVYETSKLPLHGGLGTTGYFDKIGFQTDLAFNLQYAYHIKLAGLKSLSFGVAAGLRNKTLDADWNLIDLKDPSIPPNGSDITHNINFGLAYVAGGFTLGLSSTQITEPTFEINQGKILSARHYYLHSKYMIRLSPSSVIQPGLLVKTDGVSTQFDVNLQYTYQDTYWAGISYRYDDALCFMAGTDVLGKYRIACAYDMTLSKIANHSQGSVEFLLAVMIGDKRYRRLITPEF